MDNLLKLVNVTGRNMHNEIPARQLSKEAGVPYTTALRIINKNSGLFRENKKGNLRLVSLNKDDGIAKNYLILSERQAAERYCNKYPQFGVLRSRLPKGSYSLVLFGSRAEETHREKSDADICIINEDGKKNISFSSFEMLYGIEINPIFLMKREFKHMMKEKEHNLADEILKKHIVLYGEEYFWNMVWQNGVLQGKI
jgi:predicted nucleotidyltransferase